MRKQGLSFAECVVFLLVLSIGFAIMMPLPHRNRENAYRSWCQSNLKQIGLGLKAYLNDYDKKFPLANTKSGNGWASLLSPYLKDQKLFQCPWDGKAAANTTDYFYNSRLSGRVLTSLPVAPTTIAFGDGLSNSPLNTTYSEFGSSWIQDAKSPARRHLDGANYGFADGHVKWFRPGVLDGKGSGNPTLRLGS